MQQALQVSVTKKSKGVYSIIIQDDKVIIRSYEAPEKTVLYLLQDELKNLKPVGGL